ncbi:hypothetical protein crov305 [Cafeteria roenbergensis virus]|uniref:Uncharacterized protein n=1 Tax=Cafeteria roenbergensis virus (strain BV-PW1) TaxID=693272 RepID=E3T576_CROVB|nr:hypothetical protein crov305 [Cafeteria roenbergensis virus BV-PW1]ADO67339.1 hypothetical protein crov305 [Cafeteria roenbergensis virus BV-PW1]
MQSSFNESSISSASSSALAASAASAAAAASSMDTTPSPGAPGVADPATVSRRRVCPTNIALLNNLLKQSDAVAVADSVAAVPAGHADADAVADSVAAVPAGDVTAADATVPVDVPVDVPVPGNRGIWRVALRRITITHQMANLVASRRAGGFDAEGFHMVVDSSTFDADKLDRPLSPDDDPDYPIKLSHTYRIFDGRHRVIKALISGADTILATFNDG